MGGDPRFLTAEGGLGVRASRFTDVLVMDLNARTALNRRSELLGCLTLLPKQPSRTGEVVWQGAELGGRVGVAERFAASLRALVGPRSRTSAAD